jgi:hypothetical protein
MNQSIPIEVPGSFEGTIYDRIQQLSAEGAIKQDIEGLGAGVGPPVEGVVELRGFEADVKYITLWPTNGDAPVRVPITDRDYYLAKPARLENKDGSKKQVSMARSQYGGVFYGYTDGTAFQPAFTAIPPQEPIQVPVADVGGEVAQTSSIKIAPRRSRRRGSRGRRRK